MRLIVDFLGGTEYCKKLVENCLLCLSSSENTNLSMDRNVSSMPYVKTDELLERILLFWRRPVLVIFLKDEI